MSKLKQLASLVLVWFDMHWKMISLDRYGNYTPWKIDLDKQNQNEDIWIAYDKALRDYDKEHPNG